MQVTLVNHTPNPELAIVAAARSSASQSTVEELWHKLSPQQVDDLLKQLLDSGHLSPFEHASFTFSLEGISRAASHQLVRHRIASYTQQSQRYVTMDKSSPFIIPDSILKNEKAFSLMNTQMTQILTSYNALLNMGIPREDARFILPNATRTNIIMTMNARELLHFFALRCCQRTQWELRNVAWEMLRLVKSVAPILFSKGGPTCVQTGVCPEGDLSCGKIRDMQKKAASLRTDSSSD